MTPPRQMTVAEEQGLKIKLAELAQEHRALDAAIAALIQTGTGDQI